MATIYVDAVDGLDTNAGTIGAPVQTIGRGNTLAAVGDTILVAAGVYKEPTITPTKTGLQFKAAPGTRPIVDGENIRTAGFLFQSDSWRNIRVEGFEVRNFTDTGISFANTGRTGSSHVITNNLVHHIGTLATDLFQYGIRGAGGTSNQITNNVVHSIGRGGEAFGIWVGQSQQTLIDGNEIYLVRKGGIRDWESLSSTITNNRVRGCWTGLELNGSVAPLLANNVAAFCQLGIYPKHCNYTAAMTFFGLTLATLPAYARVWHNTVYRSRWAGIAITGPSPVMQRIDIRNNIMAGKGTTLITDSVTMRTEAIVNNNVYSTAVPTATMLYWDNYTNPPLAIDIKTLAQMQTDLGWETSGQNVDPQLIDPDGNNFDYLNTSPITGDGAALPTQWGTQIGARGPVARGDGWKAHIITAITQSWNTGSYGSAGSLFDDKIHTGPSPPNTGTQWATGDLGATKTITHAWQDPHTHARPFNVRTFQLDVSADNVNWTTVMAPSTGGTIVDSAGATSWHPLPAAASGRYVRFWMLTNYGDPATIASAGFGISEVTVGGGTPVVLSAYDAVVDADNPVFHAKLGEPSGGPYVDRINDASSSTVVAPVTSVASPLLGNNSNGASKFDGTTSNVLFPDSAALDVGDVFTLEAWFKRDAGSLGVDRNLLNKLNNGYAMYINTANRLTLRKAVVADIVASTVTITDTTTWHHAVVTKNGATSKIYLDGVDVTGTVTNQTVVNNTLTLNVGLRFGGLVDEAAVYPTALSAARVSAHYNAATPAVAAPNVFVRANNTWQPAVWRVRSGGTWI